MQMQRKEVDSRHVRNVRPDSRPHHYHRQCKSATMGNYFTFITCTMKLDIWQNIARIDQDGVSGMIT